jgi:DNA polymerase II small subunit/DNA polymerase delta subunit B
MDRGTILRRFLILGSQVDNDALNELVEKPDILNKLLEMDKNNLPTVITPEFLNSISESEEKAITVEQLSQKLNYRYNFIRNLLTDNEELANLISINRINENLKAFSIIGMVIEKNDSIIVEDGTGRISFRAGGNNMEYVVDDDIIGLVCEQEHGRTEVRKVVYPDIPFRKDVRKSATGKKCIFISDLHMGSPDFNKAYYQNLLKRIEVEGNVTVYTIGGISKKKEDVIKFEEDVKQHHGEVYPISKINETLRVKTGEIEILLVNGMFLEYYMKLWNTPPDATMIQLIKKRNLSPTITPSSYSNGFLLGKPPDIIAVGGTGHATSANHKGTTVLTSGSFKSAPVYWLVNLQSRETFKIDLS